MIQTRVKKAVKNLISGLSFLLNRANRDEIVSSCSWIDRVSRSYIRTVRTFPGIPVRVFADRFTAVVRQHINASPESFAELKERWISYFKTASEDTKMFMTKLFYLTGLYDDDVSRLILNFAQSAENRNYRYWTTMDSSKFNFLLQKGYYPGYYEDRSELLKQIAVETVRGRALPAGGKGDSSKLCIVTYLLDPDMHNSMQRVAAMVANGLAKHFKEIMVVSLESFSIDEADKRSVSTLFPREHSAGRSVEISRLFEDNVILKYAEGTGFTEKLRDCLDSIYRFDPYCILDISDEYSSISYFYSKDYPTYYLPMRGGGSSSFFGSIFVSDPPSAVYGGEMITWLFPEYVPQSRGVITRKDIGADDDAFIVVTAGNNDSLENEFIDAICPVIENNGRLVWIFVGNPAPAYLHSKYGRLIKSRKVIEWGYETDLAALYKSCDIILRANVKGGSGATAIAVQQGLPVVMTDYRCDPMRWLGTNHSSSRSYEDLGEEIVKLASDREYYASESKRARDKLDRALDHEKAWSDLAAVLKRPQKHEG